MSDLAICPDEAWNAAESFEPRVDDFSSSVVLTVGGVLGMGGALAARNITRAGRSDQCLVVGCGFGFRQHTRAQRVRNHGGGVSSVGACPHGGVLVSRGAVASAAYSGSDDRLEPLVTLEGE